MDALLLLIPRKRAHAYTGLGDFFMSSGGHLSRPSVGEEAPFVYIGVQLLHPRIFEQAPPGPFSMNLLWDKVIKNGRLSGYIHGGEWFHMSTPQDLEKYVPIIASIQALDRTQDR